MFLVGVATEVCKGHLNKGQILKKERQLLQLVWFQKKNWNLKDPAVHIFTLPYPYSLNIWVFINIFGLPICSLKSQPFACLRYVKVQGLSLFFYISNFFNVKLMCLKSFVASHLRCHPHHSNQAGSYGREILPDYSIMSDLITRFLEIEGGRSVRIR